MPELFTVRTPPEAWEIFRQHLQPLRVTETIGVVDALDRVLAEALTAPHDLPAFARSTVDGFAVAAQADVTVGAYFEQREIQTAMFKTADFVSKVTITDADIEAFYKSHQAQFHVPEQATIEYVVLNLDSVKKSIVIIIYKFRCCCEVGAFSIRNVWLLAK